MTTAEFYEMIKEYAKKEMLEEGKKYTNEKDPQKAAAHLGASNEAQKFYQMIEMTWIDAE